MTDFCKFTNDSIPRFYKFIRYKEVLYDVNNSHVLIKTPKSNVKPRNGLAFRGWKQFLERNGPHKGFDVHGQYLLMDSYIIFSLLIHLLIYLVVYLSAYLFYYLYCLLMCLFIWLFICLFTYFISYLYIYLCICGSIPGRSKAFFPSPNRSVHRTYCSVGTGANFAGVKAGFIWKHCLQLQPIYRPVKGLLNNESEGICREAVV